MREIRYSYEYEYSRGEIRKIRAWCEYSYDYGTVLAASACLALFVYRNLKDYWRQMASDGIRGLVL